MNDAASAAPVAWRVHPFDYGIGHQGVYAMTMLEQQRDAWLRKGWKVEPLYVAPQAVVEPLADSAIVAAFCDTPGLSPRQMVSCFVAGARFAEQHHGINRAAAAIGEQMP